MNELLTDKRPAVTAMQAGYAAAAAGTLAARAAARQGGDPEALHGLMSLAEAAQPPHAFKPLTLDVLICTEERDRLFAGADMGHFRESGHLALCFADPPRAWAALQAGREPFDAAVVQFCAAMPPERLAEFTQHASRAFRALQPDVPSGENPPAAGQRAN